MGKVTVYGAALAVGLVAGSMTDDADAKKKSKGPLWAVVDAQGNISRDKGVNSVVHPNTGVYEVFFDRPVEGCAYTVTTSLGYAGQTGTQGG